MIPGQAREPRSRRAMLVGSTALVVAILATGAMVAHRARREAHAEELLILQGVRKVCRLATVELTLADYARKTVPKMVDLPFTREPQAFLFYSGVVSAGFDVCDAGADIAVDHAKRTVRVTLPPPRLVSVDLARFEHIHEDSGFLNAITPEDRNRWYAEARTAVERAALAQGALDRAQTHARELFAGFVERYGYTMVFVVDGVARRAPEGKTP